MKRDRGGFTLLELVVVIVISLLLLALVVPSVQRSREAARRQQCKNNLKTIGLALHNYHDSANTIPPGWIGPNANGTFLGWGWQTMVLPYMDADNLYNQLNFSLPLGPNSGMTGKEAQRIKPAYRCPADNGPDTVTIAGTTPANGVFGRSNYVAVYGASDELPVGPQIVPWGVVPTGAGGAFHQNSSHHLKEFEDGLSYVILVGERHSPVPLGGGTLGGDAIWAGVPIAPKQTKPNQAPTGTAADQQSQAYAVGDCHPATSINSRRSASGGTPPPTANPSVTGFSSMHSGGAHFLIGDGTVRFISENMDAETFRNLSTIAGGKKIVDF